MKPISFEGCNVVYGADQPEYQPLPTQKFPDGQTIQCWQLSPEEIQEVMRSGRIYVMQHTFRRPLQPIAVSTTYSELIAIHDHYQKG